MGYPSFATDISQVVDRAACTTQAPNERFLAVHADHVEICNLRLWDGTAEKTELSQFVGMVLKKAEETISSRLEACEYGCALLSAVQY